MPVWRVPLEANRSGCDTRITSNNIFVEAVTLVGDNIVFDRQDWSQKFKRLKLDPVEDPLSISISILQVTKKHEFLVL